MTDYVTMDQIDLIQKAIGCGGCNDLETLLDEINKWNIRLMTELKEKIVRRELMLKKAIQDVDNAMKILNR